MEIISPAYPKNNASPAVLYGSLCELYAWTAEHRDWANAMALKLNAPDNPFIPELGPLPSTECSERFLNLAVPDMFMSWQGLRRIREKYDDIVRNYESETEWESNPSVFHRINIVKMAAVLLTVAFLNYEHREAKGHEYTRKARHAFLKHLKKVFTEVHNFSDDDDNDSGSDTGDDFDSLFSNDD